MTVGGVFVYVCETCERGRIKDFEQRSRVYNAVRYNAVHCNAFFPVDPVAAAQQIFNMIDQT